MKETCEDLLRSWCGGLLKLQLQNRKEPSLQGGILCPACGIIHGRCFDAIYPFLYLADAEHDDTYKKGAELLFQWAEHTVSRSDGSYVNDINSPWKGTTVFSVIQLIEALTFHGHVLGKDTFEQWKARMKKAADFLAGVKEFEVCNVNYRIACSLAMELCADFLGEERYRIRGKELSALALPQLTEDGLLAGEGRPTDGFSPRGCRPVDIGYNLEESLPSFLQYAVKTGNASLKEQVIRVLKRHLLFMLDDGGMDNSFGTRNYKWTYWGSRTSDGCVLGCLLAASGEPELGTAAFRNLSLLKACTFDGLLYGGLHMRDMGEPPCVHHTFAHAKVLAGILDQELWPYFCRGELPRSRMKAPEYMKELDTWVIPGREYTATVTAYDWEYGGLPKGHPGGGTLSLLWHKKAGLTLCSSMGTYSLKEPYNMTMPRFDCHECLTPRLEMTEEGKVYSSLYDHRCRMVQTGEPGPVTVIEVRGCMTSQEGRREEGREYAIRYIFEPDRIRVLGEMPEKTRWILPVVSGREEEVMVHEQQVTVKKGETYVTLMGEQGKLSLPHGTRRIYNLVPGAEALRLDLKEEKGRAAFSLSFRQS